MNLLNNISTETKVFGAIIGATVILVVGAALTMGGKGSEGPVTLGGQTVSQDILVRSDSWSEGTSSAKVTLVEFSDFQCPACKAAEPGVESLRSKYRDQIRFVYRHFPLPAHQFAIDAGVAAEAAGKQGKFWEMHNKLFDISPDLTRENIISGAKDLGLNVDEFTKDLDSDVLRQRVLADQSDGNKANVDATPTFFINGTRFVGLDGVEAAIASDLKK